MAIIKRSKGDKIEFSLGLEGGGWGKGVLTSDRTKDEQGRWGYHVRAKGYVNLFVYTSYVRTPKVKA